MKREAREMPREGISAPAKAALQVEHKTPVIINADSKCLGSLLIVSEMFRSLFYAIWDVLCRLQIFTSNLGCVIINFEKMEP